RGAAGPLHRPRYGGSDLRAGPWRGKLERDSRCGAPWHRRDGDLARPRRDPRNPAVHVARRDRGDGAPEAIVEKREGVAVQVAAVIGSRLVGEAPPPVAPVGLDPLLGVLAERQPALLLKLTSIAIRFAGSLQLQRLIPCS